MICMHMYSAFLHTYICICICVCTYLLLLWTTCLIISLRAHQFQTTLSHPFFMRIFSLALTRTHTRTHIHIEWFTLSQYTVWNAIKKLLPRVFVVVCLFSMHLSLFVQPLIFILHMYLFGCTMVNKYANNVHMYYKYILMYVSILSD